MRRLGTGTGGCGQEYPSEFTWGDAEDEQDPDTVQRTLFLKRAILDPSTDDSELILELEVKTDSGNREKFPFLYMSKELGKQMNLDIAIPDTGTVRVLKGTGPVIIIGEIIEEWAEGQEESVEEEEEVDEEEEEQLLLEVDLNDEDDETVVSEVNVNGTGVTVTAPADANVAVIGTRSAKRKTEDGPTTPSKKSRIEDAKNGA